GYVQFGDVGIPEVDAQPGDRGLHRLYVDTSWQGRGLGRRLLTAALEHPRLAAAGPVFLGVWEQNDRGLRLFERFGLRRGGTTSFTIGAEEMEDLVLVLDRR